MGYQNANIVAAMFGHLPGASFKVLVRMALSSADKDKPAHYFAGPGPLLLALGRHDPDDADGSRDADLARHANAVALRAAVGPLRRAGIVSYAVAPGRGRTAEYWLHLDPFSAGKPCAQPQGNPALSGPIAQENPAPCPITPQENPAPIDEELQMRSSDERETGSSSVSSSPARLIHKPRTEIDPLAQDAERNRQHADLSARYPIAQEAS